METFECVLCEEDYNESKLHRCRVCNRKMCKDHATSDSCPICDFKNVCDGCINSHFDRTNHDDEYEEQNQ